MEEEIKKLEQPKKTKRWLIIIFIIILIKGFLYSLGRGRHVNKDASFKALASSIRAVAIECCETPNADFIVPPTNGGPICNTTSNSSVWPDDTQLDNISITISCQKDGSFKFHVERGADSISDCTAADCTQDGCTFTGCTGT